MSESDGSSESDSGGENDAYEEGIFKAFLNIKSNKPEGVTRKEIQEWIEGRPDINQRLSKGWQKRLKPTLDEFKTSHFVYFLRGRYRMDDDLKTCVVNSGIVNGITEYNQLQRKKLYNHQQKQQKETQRQTRSHQNQRNKSKSRQKQSKRKLLSFYLFCFLFFVFLVLIFCFVLFWFFVDTPMMYDIVFLNT